MTAVEITSLSLTAIGLAFAAGLLSFISPCVLPLLPVYLSFISGVGVEDLGREHRRRLLWTSLLFIAGFTVVFVLMGAGAGGVEEDRRRVGRDAERRHLRAVVDDQRILQAVLVHEGDGVLLCVF